MKDIDFTCLHSDAMESLAAVETLLSHIRKITEMSAYHMDGKGEYKEDPDDTMDDPMARADKVIDDRNLGPVLDDFSGETNMVNRASKEERKKMMVIKLKKIK